MIKSVYKLDKRIKDVLDIQSSARYDDSFIGEVCYFADSIWEFEDLESCNKGTLSEHIEDDYCQLGNFTANEFKDDDYYGYFIPEKLLKPVEKKYRPYSKNEFLNKFKCGEPINIRHKDDHTSVFIETIPSVRIDNSMDNVYIHLYEGVVDLQRLFDEFEWQESNGEWKPFGVEVEE